jgi:hypothetical protein
MKCIFESPAINHRIIIVSYLIIKEKEKEKKQTHAQSRKSFGLGRLRCLVLIE